MASKRIGIMLGGALAGALLLGTAGLVLAQEPGSSGGSGMMGDQLARMQALHDQMVASGTCDPAQMQQLHAQLQPGS